MLQFCSVSNSLSHTTLSNKVLLVFIMCRYDSACICIWVYNRWWLKPKWIKHVTAQVDSAYLSGWNVTLYLQFKRFFFSPNQQPSPSKLFWSRIDPNATIKWSMKVQKVNWLWDVERRTLTVTPAAFNITQTRLKLLTTAALLMTEAAWPETHYSHLLSTFSMPMFLLPYRHKLWLMPKSVTQPYQKKY